MKGGEIVGVKWEMRGPVVVGGWSDPEGKKIGNEEK